MNSKNNPCTNFVLLAEEKTPSAAWARALEVLPGRVVANSTAKLARCISVFNRVSAIPECASFLDELDLTELPDYEYLVKLPLHMRKIRENLGHFVYQSEFEFACDMRHVLSNAMHYTPYGKEINYNASQVLDIFNRLFLKWVVNTPCRVFNGPWTAWSHMRFYDIIREVDATGFCTGCGAKVRIKIQFSISKINKF